MTKCKLCGLSRASDIEAANELKPEYIGFVFAPKSRRYVSPQTAGELKKLLSPEIHAVGVFVNEDVEKAAELLRSGIIDIAQLHGDESEEYISQLRKLTDKQIIKAFKIKDANDISDAKLCSADYILLDSGAGTGKTFDWKLLEDIHRLYFLAGGLTPDNAADAVRQIRPYAVDVSSGIESDGIKDKSKMTAFVEAVRKEDRL